MSPTKIQFDADTLRPLIKQVVTETLAHVADQSTGLGRQLAYPEAQAAALLGVQGHVLRDLRLRGEIEASKVGKRIVYSREDLVSFLQRNRWTG